jgi:3-hydroxybutyrate dehydrogenase
MQINCEHPVKASRLALRSLLKAKKPGVVMCISSIAGQTVRLDLPIYCASKAFINHFVWSMAELEHHADIRVMAVAPG